LDTIKSDAKRDTAKYVLNHSAIKAGKYGRALHYYPHQNITTSVAGGN